MLYVADFSKVSHYHFQGRDSESLSFIKTAVSFSMHTKITETNLQAQVVNISSNWISIHILEEGKRSRYANKRMTNNFSENIELSSTVAIAYRNRHGIVKLFLLLRSTLIHSLTIIKGKNIIINGCVSGRSEQANSGSFWRSQGF